MTIRPKLPLLSSKLQRPNTWGAVPRDPQCLWLDKNENLDSELAKFSEEILRTLPISTIGTYPEAAELYKKLASWLDVSIDSLVLTPGSDGAIRMVFECFVDEGDTVIHTNPTFAMYPVYSQMFGANVFTLDYLPSSDGPYLDRDNIITAIGRLKPKLVNIPNPDSPSGSVLDKEFLIEVLRVCESAGAVLLIDEAYHPFYADSMIDLTQSSENLIVARTFAKAWGAAGFRIGYAVAHPNVARLLHKLRPMYEVGSISVEFMSRLLDHPNVMQESVARIDEGKTYFIQELQSLGYKTLPTNGNFIHVNFGSDENKIHEHLMGKVLYRRSFDVECLKGYSRFSIAPKPHMIRVINWIRESLNK